MELFFFLGSMQSFFFATLFISKKRIIHAHQVLITFFLLNGLILLDHFLEKKEIIFSFPHLLGLTYTLPIILGPFLLYYTFILTAKGESIGRKTVLLHASPFLLLTIYFLFDYYFLSAEEKLAYYYAESQVKTSPVVYLAEFFLNFSIPVYSFLSILRLNKHRQSVRNNFSYTEKVNLSWLYVILLLFCVTSVVTLATNLLSDVIPLISYHLGDDLIFSSLTISIFFIGYFGIRQKAIYTESSTPAPAEKNQYQNSGLKTDEYQQAVNSLLEIMAKEQPYLDGKLTLKDLAACIQLSENNLSQLLNDGLGKSFYDFINTYRVEEVKRKILDPKYAHLSLLGIALDSGFNSKSSFNHIFKKHTGTTPSAFQKTVVN